MGVRGGERMRGGWRRSGVEKGLRVERSGERVGEEVRDGEGLGWMRDWNG